MRVMSFHFIYKGRSFLFNSPHQRKSEKVKAFSRTSIALCRFSKVEFIFDYISRVVSASRISSEIRELYISGLEIHSNNLRRLPNVVHHLRNFFGPLGSCLAANRKAERRPVKVTLTVAFQEEREFQLAKMVKRAKERSRRIPTSLFIRRFLQRRLKRDPR